MNSIMCLCFSFAACFCLGVVLFINIFEELTKEDKALALQEQRVEAEENENQETLQAVSEGQLSPPVKYKQNETEEHISFR